MAKILFRGETQQQRWLRARFTCYSCRSQWTPEAEDLAVIRYDDGDFREGPQLSMPCPVCKTGSGTALVPRVDDGSGRP